jgi:assimilatory nitrate reductase catalytic subunit
VQGIDEGKIKGLWVVATNSAHSWINQHKMDRLLGRLEFLVVQDMFTSTETAQRAHLILPAAGWGEKEGTFINSERRIGHVKKVARAPGKALADFHIFQLVAQAWGCDRQFTRWDSPEAVFQILKEACLGQPCDIMGIIDYAMIDAAGGIQWPWINSADSPVPRERRLFEDGRFYHPDGKARFIFEAPRPLPEAADSEYPLLLLTGRGTSAQWHTGTRTEKSPVLRKLRPDGVYVEINPQDARRFGVAPHPRYECGRDAGS